ncbi:MAG TPA: serine/threonine-protein kinase [Polyangiaceae bacterium LLY-WYZ-15_(1-7)]|nr:serine/threonine-protein kinase [Polyangiaceae bacterium LLY-WYZ-15_(1-7)]HJL12658.1 serine/threonine-protein kinase [Polyangiaceae bacterium LLY-WYZ-15_(1-7)]HJL25626.1 serine/threonine-protein kinase [Polyangiaceae bacterium LLY-WYZ-15_(1-7)]HJL27472.1 serine/threonine-protein kinase [Polyangiaceae bacterium LLY-WYZ-15_(1-7)]HJL39541.1 serine/threonine-protein kinase [Polyangiaceae bacterium LLY-WYZ-15_(1-7)]
MSDAPPDLPLGRPFRGLRVHGVLGRGGMGTAYLASHEVLRRPLVLKLFRPQGPELFREAHLAARVASPHVVGVLDAGIEAGAPFVVQHYVDGLDLQALLEATRPLGPLPTAAVVRLVADVARGLAAIHRAGVVHGDIKPANLFLGGDGRALLGDFGIARDPHARPRADDPDPAAVAGTPIFFAPERWTGAPSTPASDLYALGVTAHWLATGAPPFVGETAQQLFYAHATEPYVPPPTDDPARAYLFTVVARLLAKAPEDRPPHAEALVRALERIAEPLPRFAPVAEGAAKVGEVEVVLRHGDLSTAQTDVLVNAAYPALTMDLGVAASLRRVGGEGVEEEARAQAPQPMGAVVWTGAGALAARHVAHAVAAIDGAICIQRAALRALLGARARGASSVAFPALGTGVGQVPHALGAKLLLETVRTHAALGAGKLRRVEVWLYAADAHAVWADVLRAM